jgi:hypothetical protein
MMLIPKPMSVRSSMCSIVRPKAAALTDSFVPNCPPYPVGRFPGLLGKIAGDLSSSGVVAPEIIGTEQIGFASLLTQGIADVTWPNGQSISIGANANVAAPSGSGKSIVFKILMQQIEKCLALLMTENKGELYDLLLEDATREALVKSLSVCPIAGVFTEEAGVLKRLLNDAPTLVKLVDGSPLRSARISTGRVALLGHRLSILLLEQPEIFEQTKQLMGMGKGGVGLVNRMFFSLTKDVRAGSSPHDVRLSDEVANAYEMRVRKLLDALFERVELGVHERPTLKLSAEASRHLTSLDREARRHCTPDSPLFFISEYILRHAERVLRLAGVFHVFEHGAEGEISLDILLRAESFGDWYVNSFAQMFYEPPQLTQVEVDADELEQLLIQTCWTGTSMFRQSEMRTLALNVGLTPTRFTRALACLCKQGRAWMMSHQNKPWIALNLSRLPQYR